MAQNISQIQDQAANKSPDYPVAVGIGWAH